MCKQCVYQAFSPPLERLGMRLGGTVPFLTSIAVSFDVVVIVTTDLLLQNLASDTFESSDQHLL